MYIMYSYEEGSWFYVVSDIQPELSGIRTGTGYAKPTEVQGKIKNNVVDFTVWLSSDYGLTMVTFKVCCLPQSGKLKYYYFTDCGF